MQRNSTRRGPHNRGMLTALLRTFSWQELRHHPWRSAAAVAAVMLGVALAFAVQVINSSALDEFSQAVRAVNGQPDLELRATRGALPESLYGEVARQPQVRLASPWLEVPVRASATGTTSSWVRRRSTKRWRKTQKRNNRCKEWEKGEEPYSSPFSFPEIMPR